VVGRGGEPSAPPTTCGAVNKKNMFRRGRRSNDEDGDEGKEEEEQECRICREEGEADHPLLHPCACSGSIKWCHEACLLDWLKASGRKNVCETCGRSLTFNPLYLANAPEVLSPFEFTWLFLVRVLRRIPVVARVVCVCATWLYFLPVFSSVALALLRQRGGLVAVEWALSFETWEQGMWILFVGFCVMFLLITVVDFVRQYESGLLAVEVEQLRQQHRLGRAADLAAAAAAVDPAAAAVGGEEGGGGDAAWLIEDLDDHDLHLDEEEEEEGNAAAANGNAGLEEFDPDEEHDGLEDWVGLRGPLARMVNHAVIVCFFVVLFLGLSLIAPELPGIALLRLAGVVPIQPLPPVKQVEGPFGVFQLANKCYREDVSVAWFALKKMGVEVLAVALGTISEMLCLFLGNLGLYVWYKYLSPGSPVLRLVWKMSTSLCRIQKVVCLFIFKMLVFPIILGSLVECATRPVVSLTMEDRLFFAARKPHLAVLLLWFTGITHTLLVSVNVILLRDILHPLVLDGVIRTRDPNVNQFLPMLLEPWMHQTKRTLVTCFIYTTIVALFVAVPIRLIPSNWLPLTRLKITLFFPSVEVPAGLVLFHLWMLTELERNKPRIVGLQERFFCYWCRVLGLSEYLLPVPVNPAEYAVARREVLARAQQMHWLDSTPKVDEQLLRPRVVPSLAYARMGVLVVWTWAVWFTTSLLILLVPFHVGMLVGYCFPVAWPWLTWDVRLFFVGWYLVEAAWERVEYLGVVARGVVAHFQHLQLVLYAFYFVCYAPVLCGLFSVLMVAPLEPTFSEEQYRGSANHSPVELFIMFFADLARSQSLARMWFAGLPILVAFSVSHTARVGVWQNLLMGRFDLAVSTCLLAHLQFVMLLLGGIALGLGMWKHALGMSKSPLYLVRLVILLVLASGVGVWLLVRNWGEVKSGCRRVHQSLKDEKYLLGKRLINFES
jgi:hypothetical protein